MPATVPPVNSSNDPPSKIVKPTVKRKTSNSNDNSPSTVDDSKTLLQRAIEQQQQEKISTIKKANAYTGKDKGIASAVAISSSSRHQSPSIKSGPVVPPRSRSSSGIASIGNEADVVNLSMAASTLASIASPPNKALAATMHSSGLPKGPTSIAYKNIQCNCKKSRCLKLYCDCFRMEKYCDGCNCIECANIVCTL